MQRTYSNALFILLLAACAADAPGLPEVLGLDPGKADVSDQVSFLGAIGFGESRDGEFVDDFQFDAYSFRGLAGARISAQVTQGGSARDLDDVLYLYGPGDSENGFAEATRLAADNDSGWGAHARIEEFALPADGDYLLIISTADNDGRGAYRVELGCLDASCSPTQPDGFTCDAELVESLTGCIEDFGTNRARLDDAFESCASFSALGAIYEDACSSPSAPAFCAVDEMDFIANTAPVCRAVVGMPYGLSAGPISESAQEAFRSWAESASPSDIAVEQPAFDGTNGLRWVSWNTASSTLEGNFERSPSASELLEIDSSWSEYLEYEDYDGTTLVDLQWETGDLYEVWQDGEVIGHVGVNYAEVNYFDSSDPDPVSVEFSVIVALDSDEAAVHEWTGIY